jgi:hypothetical protein
MKKRSTFFVLAALFLAVAIGQAQQPCASQPPNSTRSALPVWAAYKTVCFYQEGDSLTVRITFAGSISSRPAIHAGNSLFIDFDDNASTGQQGGGRVGSETNLTFNDWAGIGHWMMEVFGLWNDASQGFRFTATTPAHIIGDTALLYKMSLVGLGLTDVSFDMNGYWIDGYIWSDPYNPGDQLDSVGLYSFNPSLVTPLDTIQGVSSKLKIPHPYKSTADSLNIIGTLDNIVSLVNSSLGPISENIKYTVTYNPFTDYPVYTYNGKPYNTFTTYIPGNEWTTHPNYWAMLQGAVFQTISELRAGYRIMFQTQPGTANPVAGTNQTWYDTTFDYNHGLLWSINHQQTFKALLGTAYFNLLSAYLGSHSSDANLQAAAASAVAQAQTAYASFSGNAFDLTPTIMTGFLLSKLGTDLSWTMKMWKSLPATYLMPTDTTSGDALGTLVKPLLINGMSYNSPYSTRQYWYQNIASVQAGAIDAITGKNIYSALKAITNYPVVDSVYQNSKIVFAALATGVNENSGAVPRTFEVAQNYPNPFNPSTMIKFTLPEQLRVKVQIYDMLGRAIATIADKTMSAGTHEVAWDGSSFPSGVYLYKVTAGPYSEVRKAVLLK